MRRGGKNISEEWFYLEATQHEGDLPAFRARDGRTYVRFPVGFPGRVILRDPEQALQPHARLRLMKAVSRAVHAIGGSGEQPDSPARGNALVIIDVVRRAPPGAGCLAACRQGKSGKGDDEVWNLTIGTGWLRRAGDSALALQRSLGRVLGSDLHGSSQGAPCAGTGKGGGPRGGRPKVLLFRNVFSEYYQNPASLQMTGATHVLLTSLESAGIDTVLCSSRFPFHDPAGHPPRRDAALEVDEFITDHEELDDVLRSNPDLSLIGLSTIEFCSNHLRHLLRYIRERSGARIAVGGIWPTMAPEHVFVHLPEADFLVRGDGEDIIVPLAEAASAMLEGEDAEAAALEALGGHEGVLARWKGGMASFRIDRKNQVPHLDRTKYAFSSFRETDVKFGISMSTSRGCIHNCRFCAIGERSAWRGMSVERVEEVLADYERRLVEIYGSEDRIPKAAREIIVWDDDFFIDPERTRKILDMAGRKGFLIAYAQGAVRSFYKRSGHGTRPGINRELLDAIAISFHGGSLAGLLIGTENYCDAELKRLGKSHTYAMIRELTLELARRDVLQSHLMILVNVDTSLDDLLQNLSRLSALRKQVGPNLHFNDPCWLINLYPTPLYKACVAKGRASEIPNLGVASVPGFREFDYPFIIPEKPRFAEVYEIARRFPRSQHYGIAGRPRGRFDGIYGPKDEDFSLVLSCIRKFLERRRARLGKKRSAEARAERVRIDDALKKYF